MRGPGQVARAALLVVPVLALAPLAPQARAQVRASTAAPTATTAIPPPPSTPAQSPSVTGPGGVTIEQGITYQLDNGPPGTPLQPELLDAYLPPAQPGVTPPGVVLVHGGGWAGGDREVLAPEAQQLAQQGWAAFTIDYRLEGDPTQLPWNDELDDVQAAFRFVATNAKRFAVDPRRLGMIGASAGGHLVALVATLGTLDDTTGHDQNAVPGAQPLNPVAVATWSGVFDLGQLASIAGNPPTGCSADPACIGVFLPNAIPTFVGCQEVNCEARYAEASPLTHVSRSTSPMFIANSQEELIPVQQPEEMIAALQKFGVPNKLVILPGALHAEEYAAQIMPATVAFLQPFLVPPVAAANDTPAPVASSGSDDHLPWIIAAGTGAVLALGLLLVLVARGRRSRA